MDGRYRRKLKREVWVYCAYVFSQTLECNHLEEVAFLSPNTLPIAKELTISCLKMVRVFVCASAWPPLRSRNGRQLHFLCCSVKFVCAQPHTPWPYSTIVHHHYTHTNLKSRKKDNNQWWREASGAKIYKQEKEAGSLSFFLEKMGVMIQLWKLGDS